MIITQTPYRISLFGGGTDYPAWFENNTGKVVGFAINKYCHIGLKRTPVGQGVKYRIVYSKIEDCDSIDQIRHPAVNGVLRYMDPGFPIEMHHMGDMPAMGGLGASSSFVVGMLHALSILCRDSDPSEHSLASMAIHVERNVIKEAIGYQDQLFAAYGGLREFTFNSHGYISAAPIYASESFIKQFEDSLVLVHTGKHRFAHEMAAKVISNIPNCNAVLREMLHFAELGKIAIEKEQLLEVGGLLHLNWKLKKAMHPEISSPDIDQMYAMGKRAGAWGGKLLGAGGGGFMLFMVPPNRRDAFEEKVGAPCVTGLKISMHGSRVILNQL